MHINTISKMEGYDDKNNCHCGYDNSSSVTFSQLHTSVNSVFHHQAKKRDNWQLNAKEMLEKRSDGQVDDT